MDLDIGYITGSLLWHVDSARCGSSSTWFSPKWHQQIYFVLISSFTLPWTICRIHEHVIQSLCNTAWDKFMCNVILAACVSGCCVVNRLTCNRILNFCKKLILSVILSTDRLQ